jgi:glutamine amidotransferase
MITIINYGIGNIRAFVSVFKSLDIPVKVASESNELLGSDKLILPGVGSFDFAMNRLNNSGMRQTLDDLVLNKKIPILGVCVGMQMLANHSEEGVSPGLGWISGVVNKFDISKFFNQEKIPHMGWNDVYLTKMSSLMTNLDRDARFYFLHSFYFLCNDSSDEIAYSNHGTRFSCIVGAQNVYGVQFHPEKSHRWGVQLLRNFYQL